jgi:hypothetical protein
MRAVEDYLSRRAQAVWAGALVYREPDGTFTLERPKLEPVRLGSEFPIAKRALHTMIAAAKTTTREGEQS